MASDISDPSDLQQPSETRPPPPFTAMTVQHEMTQPNRSHDTHHQSHDVPSESYDESVESRDESGMRSHDESGMRSHDVDPEMVRLESQLDGWCFDLKRNILVSARLKFGLCFINFGPSSQLTDCSVRRFCTIIKQHFVALL